MDRLLIAVQAALQAGLSGLRDSDIFIAPHPDYVRPGSRFPAIGIKDGPVERIEDFGGQLTIRRSVHLCLFTQNVKPDGSMLFELIGLVRAVHTVLDASTLDLDRYISAFCKKESESVLLYENEGAGAYLQKILTYQYEAEEDR